MGAPPPWLLRPRSGGLVRGGGAGTCGVRSHRAAGRQRQAHGEDLDGGEIGHARRARQGGRMSLRRLAGQHRPLKVSFEFFPPRPVEREEQLWRAIRRLEPLGPAFVSVTYGAGGSTRERTHATVKRIVDETSLAPAAHLTCVASPKAEIEEIVRGYWDAGIRHIVALRGDMPDGSATYAAHPSGYASTPELIAATHATVKRIVDETSLAPAARLTCVASPKAEIEEIVRGYWDAGIRHIVALRGDMPDGSATYAAHPSGYASTPELIAAIRAIAPFEVSVGTYPERHPDSRSLEHDVELLRAKVAAGACRAITQFGFDKKATARFRDLVAKRGRDVAIVPGLMPTTNIKGVRRMAAKAGASIPGWLNRLYEGLDDDAETRKLVAAAVLAEQVEELRAEGFDQFHFYTLNQADLTYAACRILGMQPSSPASGGGPADGRGGGARGGGGGGPSMPADRGARIAWLKQEARKRILLLDGSWGVMIQGYGLREADFRGARFADHSHSLKGNIDILTLTRPDIIREVGHAYLAAGADILETNTFTTAESSQGDYGLSHIVHELCEAGARLARQICDEGSTPERPRLVAGVLSPTNRTASISPDVNDPAFRNITFDELRKTYRDAARGLIAGGADLLMIETIFDTLNAKAAIYAIDEVFEELNER